MRTPRRLPRGIEQAEIAALLASFRSERDRAIAGNVPMRVELESI